MKVVSNKSEAAAAKPEAPKAIEATISVIEIVLGFHSQTKPTLGELSRISARAAGLLKVPADDRVNVENTATLTLARKLNLVS